MSLVLTVAAVCGIAQTAPPAISQHFLAFDDGRMLYQAGRYQEAVASFDKAIKGMESAIYLTSRAKALIALGRKTAARADLDRAIKLEPNNHEAFEARANINTEADDIRAALADLTNAIESAERLEDFEPLYDYYILRAGLHRNGEDDTRADADLKSARKLGKHTDPDDFNQVGVRYTDIRYYGLALIAHHMAVESHPKNALYLSNRARVLSRLGEHSRALDDINQAIALESSNGKHYVHLGNFQRLLEKEELAIAAVNKALTLLPATEKDYRRLAFEVRARSNCALGKKADAVKDEAEFVKLGGKLTKPCN
jgi:tetratricopeptide (TPR) repeat protein